MPRWLLAGGLLVVLFGCKAKSYAEDAGSDDDGGDDGGACTCSILATPTNVTVSCGESTCVDGTEYLCSDGTPLSSGACGVTDASFQEETVCNPICTGTTCGGPDSCGGTCGCSAGIQCNPNGTCGNGCEQGLGASCVTTGSTAATCCTTGFSCQAPGDSGVATCCATTGGGQCVTNTDCCDYPAVTCSKTTNTCSP
jgi:hypothetical protein